METQLDDVLNRIYFKNYSESKEIAEELNRLLLEKNLTEPQIAYFSSRIFNSPQNLFNFCDQNSEDKDRDSVSLRKYIFESIASYIKARKEKITDYLPFIKDNCLRLFKKDVSNTAKEAVLHPLIKILKYYEAPKIKDIFDCDQISNLMLDEIKLFKPTAGMRARIWYVLALLTQRFPVHMDQYQVEIQDVMFTHLNEQMTSSKPEQNAMAGMLKAFRLVLNKSYLTAKQVEKLYLIVKVTMTPLDTVKRYNVLCGSLKLFEAHHKLFKQYIIKDTEELYEKFMKLVSHPNSGVREASSEAFEAYITELADVLDDESIQKDKFTYLMKKFGSILDSNSSDTISITLVIRSVGIFSKAMKKFLGDIQLKRFFSKLIDLSEQKVINIFKTSMNEDKQDRPDTGGFNFTGPTFKQILYKQRLLYSFLNSFALLIVNVRDINERESNHLYELALLGYQYNLKFLSSYRDHLYDGISHLIMAMSTHQSVFLFWLKKLIAQGMLETLKIPDNVYYAGEDYHYSLRYTCDLWTSLLDRPKIWSETYCKIFFDEIILHVNDLINNLDLGYTIKYQSENDGQSAAPELSYMNAMEYVPTNMNDSQYMYRIALFVDEFFLKAKKAWLQPWIPVLTRSAVYKLRIYPRCIALLKLMTTLNELMEETGFFAGQVGNDKDHQELCKIFYSELFEKYKEYQDELLNDALKVLLSIPSHFIIIDTEMIANNLILAIKRALQVGLLNIYIADSAINALERLVQKLTLTQDKSKHKKAMTFLTFITPLLSDFMIYETKPSDDVDVNVSKFNLKMKEVTINKKQVSEKVVEFLGRRGGLSHLIIPSEFRDLQVDRNLAKEFLDNKSLADFKKVNLISWDHENTFTFPLPLFSKKVDVDLIKVIPKIVEIVSTSTDRRMKVTACELLHSLIIYMIGKSAQQNNAARGKAPSKANFANLYSRILPVIFTIAADPEDISTKIFNTLCLQIVRWFSSSKDYENKEVACLLDTLMNCVSVKDNSNLRDFAAVCIGEFVKWSIKQTTSTQIKENYGSIKSVIRRIENNSNYPDIYHRYGAILALKHIIPHLREENFLVEKYLLEITQVTLNIIKMSAYSQNTTGEMKENMNTVAKKLGEVIVKRWNLVEAVNPKRGKFENIDAFLEWLYTQLLSYEKDYREKGLLMWEIFVDEIVKHKKKGITSHKEWIAKATGSKYILKECKNLEFNPSKFEGTDIQEKVELVRKNNKLLDAQLHIYATFLNKGYISLDEAKKFPDFLVFVRNVQTFLVNLHKSSEERGSQGLSQQDKLIESDPTLFKSKLGTLLHIFTFLIQSKYFTQFLNYFLTENFDKRLLYQRILMTLISPFEGVEVNPTFNIKADKWRIATCSKLLKRLKESERDFQDENKFFEEFYIQEFLANHKKFDLTSPNSFLRYFVSYTEFQIKSFFEGYDGLFQDFFETLTNSRVRQGAVGAYLKKCCEILHKFIGDNLQRVNTNQEEKFLILLKFALKFHPDPKFILDEINSDNQLFQKFQVEMMDSLARKWQYDEGDLTLKLISKATNEDIFNRILIPLTQRVIRYVPNFLTKIAEYLTKSEFKETPDEIVNTFTKFYYILLSMVPKQSFLQHNPNFRKYLHKFILQHINPRKTSLKTIIEVINLLGLYIKELGDDYAGFHQEIIESLEPLQGKYFPIKTADIIPDSAEDSNFRLVLGALMNMILMTNRVELLKVLYPFIREKECIPKYEKKLAAFCQKLVKGIAETVATDQHAKIFGHIFGIFMDKYIDDQIENNLRWQIMYRIGFPFLEEVPLNSLEEIMIRNGITLENMIIKDSFKEVLTDFAKTIDVLQEKSIACGCIDILYKRLPGEFLRGKVSKKLYGESSTKELHKVLIMPLHNGKRKPLDQKDFLLNHEMNKKVDIEPYMRKYHSMCYAALCSIIKATQTKEGPFNSFLIQVARDKGDQLWEIIVEKKDDFAFEVQTNFNVTLVEKTDEDFKKKMSTSNLNNIIASKYIQESFFSQRSDHHGFLNWEFDPTQVSKRKGEDKNEENKVMEIEEEGNGEVNPLDIEFAAPKKKEEALKKENPKAVEVDKINQHPCMFSLLRVIDHLHQNFPGDGNGMPSWMTGLHTEAIRPEASLSVKIFIIKVVINREELFRPYAREWSEVFFDYCLQKNNGGKGFHYFLRDVCTTLLTWHSQGYVLEESLNNKKTCSDIIMNLMKVAADKTALIFRSNLKIMAGLMEHWKKNLMIDKDLVQKMLLFDETKEGAHLWRMTALQILDIMLNLKIPFGTKGQYQNVDQISIWDDNFVTAIMKNMKFSSRHQVPFLASAVSGKMLVCVANLAGRGSTLFSSNTNINVMADKRLKEIEKLVVKFLIALNEKEDDKFAYFLENIMMSYQAILVPEMLYKCQGKIHNTTKKTRGAIFNSLRIFIDKAPNLLSIQNEIRDICFSLRGSFEQIVRDYSEENLLNFFRLLYQIVQLNSEHSRDLMKEKIEPLGKSFLETANEAIVDTFFSIITYIYDQNDEDMKNIVKGFLLKGLNHNIQNIRSKIFDFLNHENRISLNPSARMLITLGDLYTPQTEALWLRSTVPLMVSIAKKSSDYERKLFDFPLERSIQFREYDPSQSSQSFKFLNRSQPLTPIFTLSQQKFEDILESTMTQSKSPFQGVRATQNPMFSQTLVNTVIEEEDTQNPYGISFTQNAQVPERRPQNRASNGDARDGQQGGEAGQPNIMATLSDTRIAAGTRTGPRNNTFTAFMATNYIKIQNVSSLGTNKVRYAPEGQQTSQLTEIRAKQQSLFLSRQEEMRRKQITASRKYRIGELPDIEIAYKDVIDPLVKLAQEDTEICTELFISIFCDLYKGEESKEISKDYLNGMKNILKTTEQYTYNMISTLHRTFLEIIKKDSGVQIDPSVIAKSGLKSYSYHTTVLLLEEMLIAGNENADAERLKKIKKPAQRSSMQIENLTRNINQVEFRADATNMWLYLIEVYGALNEDDGVRGLLSIVVNDTRIREALDLKLNQNYSKSIKPFNELLEEYNNDPNLKQGLNQKIYEYLEEEKRETLAALGKWDIILKETDCPINTDGSTSVIPINTIKEKDAFYLVKGLLYNDDYWPTMNDYVSGWRENEKTRDFVDSRYSWEMGLLAITQKDYDRAKYFVKLEKDNFLKKWEKLDLFSEAAKHEQLQHLQKVIEFQEFLNYIDNTRHADEDTINKEFLRLTERWMKRPPSLTYDSVHAWNDILFAREMFCNVVTFKHYSDREGVVEAKVADLYVENARGLLKKGILEIADSNLNKAIRIKGKQEENRKQFDYKAISSVIKLKLRIIEQDENRFSQGVGAYLPKYNQIVTVIEGQQKKFEGRIDESAINKLQLLKVYSKEKTLAYLYESYFLFKDHPDEIRELPQEMANNAKFIHETFQAILNSNYFTLGGMGIEESADKKQYRSKVFSKYATFAEGLLRIYEESHDPKQPNTNLMATTFIRTSSQFLQKNLAKTFMTYLCNAFNLGFDQLQHLPKLFDILLKYPELAPIFKKESSAMPAWLFLKWLPQMTFLLHLKDLEAYVGDLFKKIVDTYPQAFIFLFNVSYDRLFQLENTQAKSQLVIDLQQKLEKFQNHYAFILSCNQLTNPEHKIVHYYYDKIREPLIDTSMNKKERLDLVAKELWSDVFATKKPFVGEQIGSYEAKFIKIWEKEFIKAFGNKLERVYGMDRNKFLTDKPIADFMRKLKEVSASIPSGYEKLSTFSSWLATYDSNNYLYEAKIEIPGQYSGNSEPFLPSHITISNFGQNVLTLGSLRRPKRITMHGSNEKSYNFLVKGIEDIRLDQRIEQLFSLMNEIFLRDTECQKRNLQIHVFQVIPMTKMLGIIEWIDNTVPIKELLGKELQNSFQIDLDKNNPALDARRKWLGSLPDCKNKGIQEQHVALLALDEKTISDNFNAQQALLPGFVLKKSLERLCSSPGAFLYIKNKFIRNYATLSVGSYILGIGDRHLENFLVSTSTGEIIPIDFGYSFGQGLTLPIPELMPFRLTRVFECLMQPMGVDGIFRNTMIQCFTALRKSRNVILDCCEIFVKDPLMDWIKTAKNKKLGMSGTTGTSNSMRIVGSTGETSLSSLGFDDDIIWYPMKKLEIVRKKLIGVKPADVMLIELQDSKFFKDPQFKKIKDQITETVKGTNNTYRGRLRKTYLSEAEQSDTLIDQARDANILGRVWIGWSPYV